MTICPHNLDEESGHLEQLDWEKDQAVEYIKNLREDAEGYVERTLKEVKILGEPVFQDKDCFIL